MFLFDLPLEQLRTYSLPQVKEPDFDAFWERALESSRAQPLDATAQEVEYPINELHVEKVSFAAYDGGRIVGWLVTLADSLPRPTLVFFHGYSGNRGKVADYLLWALQGFTVLTFDVRGQCGDSTDHADYPSGRYTGWMTSGILTPEKYYFTRAYVDTVRAVDYACTRSEVEAESIGVSGVSQGGGLSLAAASLDPRPRLCMPEVPAFGHFRRTLELTKAAPWTDLIVYFQRRPWDLETAMRTLSYVELNNLADRIQCPTLVSCGLQDELCPPSTIFTAYNRIPVAEKRIDTYAFNGHEGGLNKENQIAWARQHLM
ncbi:MAG: alpha/beta fold hydrolase [Candidatus Hydrogenedentes bacterium]|nr:alpha/beta fold hydrolase [Candidatus Hydrogenedentota bacterium]